MQPHLPAPFRLHLGTWLLTAAAALAGAPTADFTPPSPISARTAVSFSATASDPDGDPLTFTWDFGEGHTAAGQTVDWLFPAGGPRTVTLRVSDGHGPPVEVTKLVSVADPLTQFQAISGFGEQAECIMLKGLQLAYGGSNVAASADGTTWRRFGFANGFPVPGRLAQNGTVAVAVGSTSYAENGGSTVGWGEGSAWTSSTADGSAWSTHVHQTTTPLRSVAARGSLFVAVGDGGAILTSTDGDTWTPRSSGTSVDLKDVAATSSGLVAVGASGTILTSADGVAWTARTTPNLTSTLRGVATDGSRVGVTGAAGELWWSDDAGQTWVSRTFGLGDFSPTRIEQVQGVWIASQSRIIGGEEEPYRLQLAVSVDGMTWSALPDRRTPRQVYPRVLDGRLFLFGGTSSSRSAPISQTNHAPTLSATWPANVAVRTPATYAASAADQDGDPVSIVWDFGAGPFRLGSSTDHYFYFGEASAATAWASDGRGGHTSATQSYTLSDPLLVWSNVSPEWSYAYSLSSVAESPTRIIATGNGYVDLATADVTAAATMGSWTSRWDGFHSDRVVAWRPPGFVMRRWNFTAPEGSEDSLMLSPDGSTWGDAHAISQNFGFRNRILCIGAADSAYVAGGESNKLLRSTDGKAWTEINTPAASISSIAFIGDRGLAVGDRNAWWDPNGSNPIILFTRDGGAVWQDITSQFSPPLLGPIHAVGDRFFVTQKVEYRIYDPQAEAVVGTGKVSAFAFNKGIRSVIRSGNTFVAAVDDYGRYNGATWEVIPSLAVSLDGVNWEQRPINWSGACNALVSVNGTLMAFCENGILANNAGTPGMMSAPTSLTATLPAGKSGTVAWPRIGSSDSGTHAWTAEVDQPWLELSATSGTAALTPELVTATLKAPGLPAGVHHAMVTLTSPGVPSLLIPITVNAYQDDYGNDIEDPSPATLNGDIAGVLSNEYDADVFAFDLPSSGILTLSTTSPVGLWGSLMSETNWIAEAPAQQDGTMELSRKLLPGRYYLFLASNNHPANYTLHTAFDPSDPPCAVTSWKRDDAASAWQFTVSGTRGFYYQVSESDALEGPWTPAAWAEYASQDEVTLTAPLRPGSHQHFYRVTVSRDWLPFTPPGGGSGGGF